MEENLLPELDFHAIIKPFAKETGTAIPPTLHHYTTPQGLIGILQTGSLRAGNALYLNDWRGLRHGLEMFHTVLAPHISAIQDDDVKQLIGNLLNEFKKMMERAIIYVFL